MRYAWVVVLAVLPLACGRRQEVTSHGQPVSHWVAELKAPDVKARRQAVKALGNLGKADPAVVPALTEALQDADAEVRNRAVLALLRLGPDARDALPALEEASRQDSDATVRANAGKAVRRVAGG